MRKIFLRLLSLALSFALLVTMFSPSLAGGNSPQFLLKPKTKITRLARTLTEDDANALVATIAKAIQGEPPYPAMTYNSTSQTYTFNAAGLSFEQVLALYERVVLADAALTSSIAGVPNFAGYNVAARLNSAHGIATPNAPARAIAAIRASLNGFNAPLWVDYDAVPAGSGWAADLNFEPAPAALAELNAAGGAPQADPGFPPYERVPSGAAPAPIWTTDDAAPPNSIAIEEPDFANYSRASLEPDPLLDPLGNAKWQFTQAIYAWIDRYESADYPAVPNTASPPANNAARENIAYPLGGSDAQKYNYLNNLQRRYQLEVVYLVAQDAALRQPENAYHWLQTKWNAYKNDPNETTRERFVTAARSYYALLQTKPDSTYANKNGAFVPSGVNDLISGYTNTLRQMEIITIYGAFFHSYRLNLQAEDFVRYSNENLRAEFAAVEGRLRQFARDYPRESLPTPWSNHLKTVQKAILGRVFDEIDSLSGDAQAIAGAYDRDTLVSEEFSYNLNNLELWALIKDLVTLTPKQQSQLTLAQQVFGWLNNQNSPYKTLHWELISGDNPQYLDDWLPTRGLEDPMVLQVGQDEFHVKYEHVENMINKLDTLLTSEWFAQNATNFGEKSSSTSESSAMPRFELPKLDSDFLSKLGQMRTSSGELVIRDPQTNIKITLPPLPTALNTSRITDKITQFRAERRWIQAYRGDVLLYLLRCGFKAVNTREAGALETLSWAICQILPSSERNSAQSLGEAVPQALCNALKDVDLTAAMKPFMTEFLTNAVSQNLLGDKLPAMTLGFCKLLADTMQPILDGPLLRRPGDTSGCGLLDDIRLASLPRVDLTLGYMLEQIAGRSRYAITVNDLLEIPIFKELFGFDGVKNWLELMLGAQITPQEMLQNWPAIWPQGDGMVPAGAPNYVNIISTNLANIYNFLQNMPDGDSLNAWQNYSNESLRETFQFGLETIADYAEQRAAFEDVMTFAMSGLAYFFSAVFSESPLEKSLVSGEKTDYWYNDLIVGLGGVTRGVNDLIDGALRIVNAPLEFLGLPTIAFPKFTLPDVRVSDYAGDSDYFENRGEPHWRGQFDGRVGVTSVLSAGNVYGKTILPIFEILAIPQDLIACSEAELNRNLAACTTRNDIARTLTRALTAPLLDWLAPMDEAKIPLSLGYRPLGKALDLLPNLAYAAENQIIANLVNRALDDLTLDVTLHMGGAGGDALNNMLAVFADEMQYGQFDMNYFLELFVNVLPNLIGAGPLLERILDAAGMGMAWIFAIPMVEIVQLPAGSFLNIFRNRNDGSGTSAGSEDDFVTILEGNALSTPGAGTRPATLATVAGFFGGDSAANALNIKLFGDSGLQFGQALTNEFSSQSLLNHVKYYTNINLSGDINTLLQSVTDVFFDENFHENPDKNAQWRKAIAKISQNSEHAIALLVELFNPQTYPAKDHLNYALLDKARSRNPVINEVQYSKIWTRKEAEAFANRLPDFLENFSRFCFEKSFLDWLYDKLESAYGLNLRQLYTTKNLKCLLQLISKDLNLEKNKEVYDKESFVQALTEVLLPFAPMLRAFLIGGRESEAPWFGEQYVNNGVDLDLSSTNTQNLGRAGDNFTALNDYIGVSGYDGYRQGVIPLLEHLGVPQREIFTHENFSKKAISGGDKVFLRLLIEPILGVMDRVVADPLNELPQVLPNLLYFLTAEGGNEKMVENGSAQNSFVAAANRVLRPIFAALDMATPLVSLSDGLALANIKYPFTWVAGDVAQDVFLAPDVSLNRVIAGFARRWFADVSDGRDMQLALDLWDIMDFMPGKLEVYGSMNGQNDAVRLNADRADWLTQVARKLIPLIFSEQNWAEMRAYIAARLPANTRGIVLYLLDALAEMVRGMGENEAADLVLAVLFHLFLGKDRLIKTLFALRECRERLKAFFEQLARNADLGEIAVKSSAALLLLGGGAAAVTIPAALGAAATKFAAILLVIFGISENKKPKYPKNTKNEPTTTATADLKDAKPTKREIYPAFFKPPQTGGTNALALHAALIGTMALGTALILKKRREDE